MTLVGLTITVTVSVKYASSKAKLRSLAVIYTVQTIVLTFTLNNRLHSEKFSLTVLRGHQIFTLGVHACNSTVSRMHLSSELVGFLKSAVNEISWVVVRILIVREK